MLFFCLNRNKKRKKNRYPGGITIETVCLYDSDKKEKSVTINTTGSNSSGSNKQPITEPATYEHNTIHKSIHTQFVNRDIRSFDLTLSFPPTHKYTAFFVCILRNISDITIYSLTTTAAHFVVVT